VPVLFVHSLAGNTLQWEAQLAHVASTRRALAVDLRGHGRSERAGDGPLRPDDYAGDIRGVMDSLKIPRAVLVGHSMGSGAAIAFASQSPDRVAGLLLVDPVDDPAKRPASPGFETFLARLEGPEYTEAIEAYWAQILEHAQPGVKASVIPTMRATAKATVVSSMRGLQTFDASAALARFRGPTMSVTTALNDGPSSLQNVIPGLRHERMRGVSHWLQLDRPDEFNRLLDRFLLTTR